MKKIIILASFAAFFAFASFSAFAEEIYGLGEAVIAENPINADDASAAEVAPENGECNAIEIYVERTYPPTFADNSQLDLSDQVIDAPFPAELQNIECQAIEIFVD